MYRGGYLHHNKAFKSENTTARKMNIIATGNNMAPVL
jgi:hypothetical protein